MLLAAVATAEAVEATSQAVSALSDQVGFLLRAVVFIVAAVVIFQFIRYGSSALWNQIYAWLEKAKQDIRDSLGGQKKDADPQQPQPDAEKPSRRVRPSIPQDFGIHPATLIASTANDSPAVNLEAEWNTADKKKYQLSYSIKEVPANG